MLAGSVNATALVPLAIAPLSCTMPAASDALAEAVPNGACDQPFSRVKVEKPAVVCANAAPSSDVKHCASANEVAACTLTSPLGGMKRRPLAAPHRSIGT